GNSPGYSSMAARDAAPAGSATILRRSRHSSTARDSDSSLTVTTSSTSSDKCAYVTGPGSATAIPSAMVCVDSSGTGPPAISDGGDAAAFLACTPATRTAGFTAPSAAPSPAAGPAPPVSTTPVATSGT